VKKRDLEKQKKQIEELGGLSAFRSGDWLPKLVARSFRSYYENATPEYFQAKYPKLTREQILNKIRKAAMRQAALVGGGSGLLMSSNELLALFTGGEMLMGLAGNALVAGLTIGGDLVSVTLIQLRLVVSTARLYGIELDLDDPEDIWIVLGFALGGEVGHELSHLGAKIGGNLTKRAIKKHLSGEVLVAVKKIASKLGFKLLQRSVLALAIPGVSIAAGALLNRAFTSRIARIAQRHFEERSASLQAATSDFASSPEEGRKVTVFKSIGDPFVSIFPRSRHLWHLMRPHELDPKLATFLNGGLWLARLDKFNDPLEGTMPRRNLGLMQKLLGSKELAAQVEAEYEHSAQNAFASCWHMSDGDPSDYAWRIFGGDHTGIAIRTTPAALKSCLAGILETEGPGYISEIEYIDHQTDFLPEAQTLAAAFSVREGYRGENEARVLVTTFGQAAFDRLRLLENPWGTPLVEEVLGDKQRETRHGLRGSVPPTAGASHIQDGFALVPAIDPHLLIQEIVIGSAMDPDGVARLKQMLEQASFRDVLRRETT
jgi:EcsC protein family